MKDYQLNGRIWLTLNDETVLGEGKICLLNHILELGSLRKAADTMKMSYRKAWFSVKHMNEAAKQPMVTLIRGGKDGGKAELTPYGLELLQNFQQQKKAFEQFLVSQNSD